MPTPVDVDDIHDYCNDQTLFSSLLLATAAEAARKRREHLHSQMRKITFMIILYLLVIGVLLPGTIIWLMMRW